MMVVLRLSKFVQNTVGNIEFLANGLFVCLELIIGAPTMLHLHLVCSGLIESGLLGDTFVLSRSQYSLHEFLPKNNFLRYSRKSALVWCSFLEPVSVSRVA